MPTGYTADIAKDISFNDFVLQCARAFGATISMRDSPMSPEIPEFQPSNWNMKELVKAQKTLVELTDMTGTMQSSSAFAYNAQRYDNFLKDSRDNMELKEKYESMLTKVQNWEPPSPEHTDLKAFMVKQIKESIEWDCITNETPEPVSGEQWYLKKLNDTTRNIVYHTEEHLKEIERVNTRNKWVKQLKESLSE